MTLPSEMVSPPERLVVGYCHFCGRELYEGRDAARYRGHVYCGENCVTDWLVDSNEIDYGPAEILAFGYPQADNRNDIEPEL